VALHQSSSRLKAAFESKRLRLVDESAPLRELDDRHRPAVPMLSPTPTSNPVTEALPTPSTSPAAAVGLEPGQKLGGGVHPEGDRSCDQPSSTGYSSSRACQPIVQVPVDDAL